MAELLDLHAKALAEFDRRVREVGDAQWGESTPCVDWDVHDLVNHMVTVQMWAPYLLSGGTVEDAGDRFDGDHLGETPVATWEVMSRDARTAWLQPDALERTVHMSFGAIPASFYLWIMTLDQLVHAWDLARAIGTDETLDAGLVEATLQWVNENNVTVPPYFAEPVPVAEDADTQTRLLALTGRRV
ncbi:TIGR03086 family metal-binding protein [Halostreptopolyspora alba]|uniref:TIGR03086 family protein n=1 Tax=Halostreptopolyspora alba TaxID=2487137 RepID=A0A3N0E5G5_9ACTN|nr:TIGR03086 family protein [Nocardiopsaceae bacterium YIM 96095]